MARDLLLPSLVLVVLAGLSLLVRREGPSTLGFHRLRHPGRKLAFRGCFMTRITDLIGASVAAPAFAFFLFGPFSALW